MSNEPKKIARLRLIKRLGIIGLVTTGTLGIVLLALSFVTSGNAAFSIRIDNPEREENNFSMFLDDVSAEADSQGQARNYVAADPMTNTDQVDAMQVEEYLASLSEYKGSQNLRSDYFNKEIKAEEAKDLALIYTVYLRNQSQTDNTVVKYALSLDAYKQPEKPKLIDYFRVLFQTQILGTDDITNTYYGNPRSSYSKYSSYPNEFGDPTKEEKDSEREIIGTTRLVTDEDYRTVLTKPSGWDMTKGNDGYCKNFNDYEANKEIVIDSLTIPAGKTIRLTYAAFFEGGDPDAFDVIPGEEAYLLLSLHLGE